MVYFNLNPNLLLSLLQKVNVSFHFDGSKHIIESGESDIISQRSSIMLEFLDQAIQGRYADIEQIKH